MTTVEPAIGERPSLAAGLPETRVRPLSFENRAFTGGSGWLNSTSRWACGYRCDGIASGSLVGLDYAQNRYYSSVYGRFNTPDPARASANAKNPQSWNRYSYALGDPINKNDPKGLCVHSGFDWRDDDVWERLYISSDGAIASISPVFFDGGCRDLPQFCQDAAQGTFLNGFYYKGGECSSMAGNDTPPAGGAPSSPSRPSGAQFAGFDEAEAALGNPLCAKLIAGSGGRTANELEGLLSSAPVTAGTAAPGNTPVTITKQDDGGYSWAYQWGTTTGGKIELNGNYFPDPSRNNIVTPQGNVSLLDLVNKTLGSSLTASQFGTLVFLHELSHMADGDNSNRSNIDTNAFNQNIISTCLK